MQIQIISPQLLMLHWTREEIASHRSEHSLRRMLILICEGCLRAGWKPERMQELELWAAEDGLTAAVTLYSRQQEWFRFDTLPECLHALSLLPSPPAAALIHYEGSWFLCGSEALCSILSEFGQALNDLDEAETAGLGESVLNSDGLERLWRRLRIP